MELYNAGDRAMNTYVYPISSGYVMIDTGYEEHFSRAKEKLAQQGIAMEDIRYIFLTHAHDDHAGFLKEMLDRYPKLQCILSDRSMEALKQGQNPYEGGGCSGRLAVFHCKKMAQAGKGRHLFPALDDSYRDRLIEVSPETKEQAEALLGGKIFFTPGHTKDSLSLQLGDRMFCGDAAMNGVLSRNRITIWLADKQVFRDSWEVLLRSGASMLYPAHGDPFPMEDLARFKDRVLPTPIYSIKGKRIG